VWSGAPGQKPWADQGRRGRQGPFASLRAKAVPGCAKRHPNHSAPGAAASRDKKVGRAVGVPDAARHRAPTLLGGASLGGATNRRPKSGRPVSVIAQWDEAKCWTGTDLARLCRLQLHNAGSAGHLVTSPKRIKLASRKAGTRGGQKLRGPSGGLPAGRGPDERKVQGTFGVLLPRTWPGPPPAWQGGGGPPDECEGGRYHTLPPTEPSPGRNLPV